MLGLTGGICVCGILFLRFECASGCDTCMIELIRNNIVFILVVLVCYYSLLGLCT